MTDHLGSEGAMRDEGDLLAAKDLSTGVELGHFIDDVEGGIADGVADLKESGQLVAIVWLVEVNGEGAPENEFEYLQENIVVDGVEPALRSELC